MCESRAVPSGKVYRQLFDAQVQLSRSLLAGRRDARTDCLSAEDSNTHCSTTSRWRCPLSSRGQGADEDVDDVTRLPDTVEVDRPSSDIIKRLTEIKRKKHEDALKQLDSEFTKLTQVCETQVRTVSLELLSSLQEVDLRLNNLKNRMEHLEHISLQEVCALWEEVKEELKLRRSRILELNQNLTETETQRTNKIRVVLRDFCYLLEKISFLPPCDVHRLIHSKATMLNQSLLANRRSVAHLVLLLQEENLQQESLLRLHWEDCVSRWRRSRVSEVIDRFRSLCRSEEEQQLASGQQQLQELKASQQVLLERRRDVIHQLCSLVPPSCSTALVSDWFNQLAAINQQIDALQADVLQQLRWCYEQMWSERLAEVERCEKVLSALELSEEEVNDVVSSQLLTLIGQSQRQDEERLAALEVCWDSAAHHTLHLSRCVFAVMRGVALLWETHSCRLGRREEEIQQHLDELRGSQQQHLQRKKVRLDDLLSGLRQESSEDTLRTSLDKTVRYLQDIKHSCSECVSAQCQLIDRLPSLSLEELVSYSSCLSSFYHLHHTYRPSPEELQVLVPAHMDPELTEGAAETQNRPISCQNEAEPTHPSPDWLTEAESSLLELYDISSDVTFTSSGGVTYSGPMFRCPAPDIPDHLRQETHLSLFPVEVITQTLIRMRTLLVDHLEQHFHDILRSVVAVATDRKEVVRSEQELQLQQLNSQHIQTHIYHPRLAELQLHRRRVEAHCEEVSEVLNSCRAELQELQTSISRKNQELSVTLSKMEGGVLTADRSARLEAVSSALQDCLDHHMKDTQHLQTSFRQTVQRRLQEVRNRTSHLLSSFRLFSEGGDFAPQEVKLFQRRLKEETRQISGTEESVLTQLEAFESRSLQQVNEASAHLQDKLSVLRSEVAFTEKIHQVISSTQVHIRAQAACSNQQQSCLSSMLEDLRRTMEDRQVSPEQVCCLLSLLNQELSRRRQYLDFSQAHLPARPKSRRQVRSAPPAGLLLPSRTGVGLLRDPAVDVIRSLNRFRIQDGSTGSEDRGGPAAGVSLVRQQSASGMRSSRTIRTDKRFQVFGPRLEPDQIPDSFSSSVNAMLWTANDILLLVAEEFYLSERSGRSRLLLPDTLDQWAESMQQRLLGYQEQARTFLSMSREELEKQLSALDELLRSLPAVLISEHERRREAELQETVGGVRQKLEEILAASEEGKRVNVQQLRASLTDNELQTLNSSEERRQQRLQNAICCTHLELQECVRVRGEEFVTSLASLTENLLHQLDNLPTPAETATVTTVTMETGAEPGPCTVSRTWSGIQYLLPTHSTADPTSSITMATTASITTSRCTLGHQAIIEQRDAAVKRFEQLFQAEMLRSDEDKRRQLSEAESWSAHWRQQIHTLTHTL